MSWFLLCFYWWAILHLPERRLIFFNQLVHFHKTLKWSKWSFYALWTSKCSESHLRTFVNLSKILLKKISCSIIWHLTIVWQLIVLLLFKQSAVMHSVQLSCHIEEWCKDGDSGARVAMGCVCVFKFPPQSQFVRKLPLWQTKQGKIKHLNRQENESLRFNRKMHYRLKCPIGFWNEQKVDKSRCLFLSQKNYPKFCENVDHAQKKAQNSEAPFMVKLDF